MEETTEFPKRIENHGIVYQDRNQIVEKVLVIFENFVKEFFVARTGKRAALVVAKDGKILFTRQYRLLINDLSFEIPGGKVNEGEPPDQAAAREAEEETGIRCEDINPLIDYHYGLDIVDNYTYLYYSHCIKKTKDIESSNFVWIPLEECFFMIKKQKIIDSLSILALYSYERMIRLENS